jgi:hypothetical protein
MASTIRLTAEDVAGVTDAGMIHVIARVGGQQLPLGQVAARDARSLPAPHNGLQTNAEFGEALAIGGFRGAALAVRELVVGVPHQDRVRSAARR